MNGPYSDLDRPPLNAAGLRRALVGGDSPWTSLDVVETTGSTNADLVERARGGAAEGAVLVAESQSAGRGRLGRTWSAPPRSGLHVSVLLRPGTGADPVAPERWGWLPLLAGAAAAEALSAVSGADVRLKWPNDLLVAVDGEDRKTGGILAEAAGPAVVVGIGVNVSLRQEELPVPTAGSLALGGAKAADRDPLLRYLLRALAARYLSWRQFGGDPEAGRLREVYESHCATLGRRVRAELPGGRTLTGEAVGVDGDGRLLIAEDGSGDGPTAVDAADVVHLRGEGGDYAG
ncbi:biotin--[acetyl-CoA-carboxylase] ligase [Mangrovactinospora gilvigrisea]|uniref:biotin--[biotin carboxyl-carrier protein] ligase n=1 Tax=Mangrovactinospora gilvigrisea TaxID=1428644 RepID=A0A1J7CAP9_9ACTN|nr:biotin--[acetyl-CoA-carboxylase] ligase [Mangrovactinospora gilvigrisea]OIV38592.1 biotin--[acetyl-CoA-carboxylase] ligase [Mangrovactinospora gilvigrisea]